MSAAARETLGEPIYKPRRTSAVPETGFGRSGGPPRASARRSAARRVASRPPDKWRRRARCAAVAGTVMGC